MREWSKGWQACWDHLQQARDVVAKRGRDVSGFDCARAAVGNVFTDAASGKAACGLAEVTVTWRNAPTERATDAIAALRAAMPDVVVTKQAPLEVELAPSSNKVLVILAVIAGLALATYLIYRAVTGSSGALAPGSHRYIGIVDGALLHGGQVADGRSGVAGRRERGCDEREPDALDHGRGEVADLHDRRVLHATIGSHANLVDQAT